MKILWLSDSALHPTGYSNQSKLTGNFLQKKGHDFYHVGHNYYGAPTKKMVFDDGEEIAYSHLGSDGSKFATNVLGKYFNSIKPDLFSILLDTFMLKEVNFENWNIPAKSAFWYPTDGGFFPMQCETILQKIDYPIAMAKFGQEQCKRLFGVKARYIPHGVHTNVFVPFSKEKKRELRLKYGSMLFAYKKNVFYPINVNLLDKFVIGCVGRNQPRKNMPELIKTFALFSKGKEDVVLLMHSDPFDAARLCDLQEIADRYGCGHKVLWTGMRVCLPFTTQQLVEVYNLMDVFCLMTSGEGFGIPFIEAMSCEIPVIATDVTTTKEIVTDHKAGLGVKLAGEPQRPYPYEIKPYNGTITGTWEVERAFNDLYDGVAKLDLAYDDWKSDRELLRSWGVNGRKGVVQDYDFETVVGPSWQQFLEEIKS